MNPPFVPFITYDSATHRYTPECPCGKLIDGGSFPREEAVTIAWLHVIKLFDHQWEEPQ